MTSIGNEAAYLQMRSTSQANPLDERKVAALPRRRAEHPRGEGSHHRGSQ